MIHGLCYNCRPLYYLILADGTREEGKDTQEDKPGISLGVTEVVRE